jgi:hypothetical protein
MGACPHKDIGLAFSGLPPSELCLPQPPMQLIFNF